MRKHNDSTVLKSLLQNGIAPEAQRIKNELEAELAKRLEQNRIHDRENSLKEKIRRIRNRPTDH